MVMRYLDEEKNKKQHKDEYAQLLQYLVDGRNKKAKKLLNKILKEKIKNENISKHENYLMISLDIRLLMCLLSGPHKAHWSNADLGSHLRYSRVGSVYKRGLFFCWNHFYV